MNSKITTDLLKTLYEKDAVFFTQHVIARCKQRGITPKQIRITLTTGEIIKDYPDDTPYPSCLILGYPSPDKPLHVVVGTNGEAAKIITAYYPDPNIWETDMKTRKDENR
ncbi:MAG: DUF4258 domain-containing protein [Pseudoramibacter sp.]